MVRSPEGVCTVMATVRSPLGRRSKRMVPMVAPAGPYQAAKCCGSVHIVHTWPMGAPTTRSMTVASSVGCSGIRGLLVAKAGEMLFHPVESGFPEGPVALRPGQDISDRAGVN